jgi:hypothetical protein
MRNIRPPDWHDGQITVVIPEAAQRLSGMTTVT